MKKIVLLFSFAFLSLAVIAQSNYNEAIQQGDEAQKRGDYTSAINKYFAAEAFDPSKKEIVTKKISEVFKKVNDLKNKAENDKIEAEKMKAEKQEALNQAEQFISAIDFYDGKFALTSGKEKDSIFYYYIDREGNEVTKLGRWKNAEPFNKNTGLAKITKNDTIYALDTLGIIHKVGQPRQAKLKEYVDIVQRVAKVELKRIPENMAEYEELVSIGIIAVQVLIKNKTPEQLEKYNAAYMATAVRWAIRNEMRIRYKWYAEKYKAEGEYDEEEKTDSVDMTQYKVREAIYETILSVALLNETANTQEQDELTEMGKMIRTAIAELPEEARKVVEYRFYNNMDVKTIAIKTGLQPSQVTRIIQSSLNFVKEYLNAREHYGY